MPTYEYQCKKCMYKFELFQKITEQPGAVCPVCQAAAQRLISAGAGIIFKGHGFYATDYRSKEYRKRKKQEGGLETSICPDSNKKEACKSCPVNRADINR